MNFFAGITGASSGGQGGEGGGEGSSLLSDWNKYAEGATAELTKTAGSFGLPTSLGDVEAGFKSFGGKLETGFNEATLTASKSMKTAGTAVVQGTKDMGTAVQSVQPPSRQQMALFMAMQAGSALLLCLAFFVALPVIILSPAKFAISFTLGCAMMMGSFAVLRGWQQQVQHMVAKERLPFSAAYVGSMFGTLYAAMVMHSYVLSIICSAMQMFALLYYVMSYFPGGTAGMKLISSMAVKMITQLLGLVSKMRSN